MNKKQNKKRIAKLNADNKVKNKAMSVLRMHRKNMHYIRESLTVAIPALAYRPRSKNIMDILHPVEDLPEELKIIVPEEVQEKVFAILNIIRNESPNNSFDWEEAVAILQTQHGFSARAAFSIFVDWTKYIDARTQLMNSIDFT
jgi:hypothetical protein